MGGLYIDEDWELAESSSEVRNIVLVGRTGNGKSSTANSILGEKAFASKFSSYGVTTTCQMQQTTLKNGQKLNVIDTPGLFDFSLDTCYVGKEIVNCIRMAKIGIHAVVVVFSVLTRFSKEEMACLQCLQSFFGPKLVDYMIVVFTGGDELDEDDQTLEDYIGKECPEPIKEIVLCCKNRLVLFDNKTDNAEKKEEQVQQLMDLVNKIMENNGGNPYSDELFNELKLIDVLNVQEVVLEWKIQGEKMESIEGTKQESYSTIYEDHVRRITDMVEKRLEETIRLLEKQLGEEKAARLISEQLAQKQLEEERNARLLAVKVSQLRLEEEKAVRLIAEQTAEKQLAKEKVERLKAEMRAQEQIAAEKAARLNTEVKAQQQSAAEQAAWIKYEKLANKQLADARSALKEAEGALVEAGKNKCVIL